MTSCVRTPAYVDALLDANASPEQESHAAVCVDCGAARMRIAAFDRALADAASSLVAEAVPRSAQQAASARPRVRLGPRASRPSTGRVGGSLAPVMAVASVALLLAGLVVLVSFIQLPPQMPGGSLGAGPADARAEDQGIVVEIWLDRHEVRLGDLVLALVRVSNRGDETIFREMNTCGDGPARTMVVRAHGAGAGADGWEGLAGEFKRFVLSGTGLGEGEWELGRFWDARVGGAEILCRLYSQAGPFAPAAVDEMTLAWRVTSPEGSLLEPGPATVRAAFHDLPPSPESDVIDVVAEAPIEILAGGSAAAEPMGGPTLVDYLDAAVADDSFLAWLRERPPETWAGTEVIYWPTAEGSYPEVQPFDRFGQRPVVEVMLRRQLAAGQRAPADLPEGEMRAVIVDRATLVVLAVRDPLSEPSETPEPLGPCRPVDEGGECFEPSEQGFIDHALASTRAWPQLTGLDLQAGEVIQAYDAAAGLPTWIVPITADGRVVAASRFLPFGNQVRLGEIVLYEPRRDSFPKPGPRERLVINTDSCGDPMPDSCLFVEYRWRLEPAP